VAKLWETARALSAEASHGKPPLWFVTDPARTPEPWRVVERMPAGAGVIHRTFGRVDALDTARRLRAVTRERGLALLIGLDEALAAAVGADGLHLPERGLATAREVRARRPGWLIGGAAHGEDGLRAAEAAGLDLALLSPVFESRSPSAGAPLGVERFADLARACTLPVYALGGVTAANASALIGSGAAGIAAVEGVLELWGGE